MALTTHDAFSEFLGEIVPTTKHFQLMEERRKNTHRYLEKSFHANSDMPLIRTQLIGSAAKGTIRAPLKDRDIDILAVFSNEKNKYYSFKNAQEFLYTIREALTGYRIETIGSRGQAVRLFYADKLHVDIAPVFFFTTGGYHLPGGSGEWIMTNPDAQLEWFEGRVATLGTRLIPVIMMVKEWNEHHSKILSSYHLETMAANLFTRMGSNYAQELCVFFDWALQNLHVEDPAGLSGKLSQHLTFQQHMNAIQRLNAAREKANKALAAEMLGNHKVAITLWGEILGSKFPTYGWT